MSLIDVQYYRDCTGDVDSPNDKIEALLDEAQQLVGDYLQRTLPYGIYTERLKLWPSRAVYPSAIPIASVPASGSAEIYDDATLINASPDDILSLDWPTIPSDEPYVGRRGSEYEAHYWYATVTYTGGFTNFNLPMTIRRAIVRLAKALPSQFAITGKPAGAKSVRVGDVGVSYDEKELAAEIDQYVPGLSKMIKGYRLDRL